MANIDISQPLIECLKQFKGAPEHGDLYSRQKALEEDFVLLAKKLLYGGYIKVDDDYKIYIKNVEFYYHEETDSDNNKDTIPDPIVYHRNGKFPHRTIPPFPIMTLHSHWSGFDITFEDPKGRYRASALIRAYSVYDVKAKGYAKWDTTANKNEKGQTLGLYSIEKEPYTDTRSTYLQFYLNGFSMNGDEKRIKWIDYEKAEYKEIKRGYRKNVTYDKNLKRQWSFKL